MQQYGWHYISFEYSHESLGIQTQVILSPILPPWIYITITLLFVMLTFLSFLASAYNLTSCYPCLFVFCISSLFLTLLPLLPNHHPTCLQFLPAFNSPFFLPVPFCRHDSFSLYLFSVIISFPLAPLSLSLLPAPLWEEDLVVRIVRSPDGGPETLGALCLDYLFYFLSFYIILLPLSIAHSLLSSVILG